MYETIKQFFVFLVVYILNNLNTISQNVFAIKYVIKNI